MFYTLMIPFVYALQCRTGKIKMSGSELRPRKVELTGMYVQKNLNTYRGYFTHTNNEPCTCCYDNQLLWH